MSTHAAHASAPPAPLSPVSVAAAASVAPLAIARMSAVLLQHLLDSASSLAARLPLPGAPSLPAAGGHQAPRQHSATPAGATPVEAAPAAAAAVLSPKSASVPHARYGMGLGEAESPGKHAFEASLLSSRWACHSSALVRLFPCISGLCRCISGERSVADEDSDSDDLTAAELRRLQQSPEFGRYMRARGQSAADVAAAASRVRLYKRLREASGLAAAGCARKQRLVGVVRGAGQRLEAEAGGGTRQPGGGWLDPSAFWLLVRRDAWTAPQSRQPSSLVLAADYVASTVVNLLVVFVLALCWAEPDLPLPLKLAASLLAWWLTVARWAAGRSTAARWFDLWYEELRWGHLAPAWRCVAANVLELAYVALTLGLGAAVSLGLRAAGRRRQAVGELLAGVAAVQEARLPVPRG
eukprot:scaffold7.g3719.t1